jgi:hypothetical protein
MIPNHILTDLGPDDRVAVLTRAGGIHFHVHRAADSRQEIEAFAAAEGSRVLASHMRDHTAIQDLVESRERDVGGEG